MSLSPPEALACLAMAQAVEVCPPLGDSYAGKSAATIAGLVAMLADGADRRLAESIRHRTRLEALLHDAGETVESPPDEGFWQGFDRLMGQLGGVLERAEGTDPALVRRCLAWLADWAASQRLHLPLPATAQPGA
jgi:hypothetical protein